MSAIVKTKLKNAREALAKKKYDSARDAATDVLSYEPDNYHAYVDCARLCGSGKLTAILVQKCVPWFCVSRAWRHC